MALMGATSGLVAGSHCTGWSVIFPRLTSVPCGKLNVVVAYAGSVSAALLRSVRHSVAVPMTLLVLASVRFTSKQKAGSSIQSPSTSGTMSGLPWVKSSTSTTNRLPFLSLSLSSSARLSEPEVTKTREITAVAHRLFNPSVMFADVHDVFSC